MPETAPEAPAAVEPEAAAAETPEAPPAPESDLGDAGKKAIAAERSARKAAEKVASDLAAKVAEFENANKSELEKAAARAEAAEKALATAQAESLRLRIASEVGIPADLHDFLTGTDEESVRGQAEKLKAATASQRRPPAPDTSQGAKPGGTAPAQLTQADLRSMSPEQIVKAKAEGRFNDLLGAKN